MAGALAGLGAFAGGLSQGLERGERLRQSREDAEWRGKARSRQEKQWEAEDALNRDMTAANHAAAERLRSFMPAQPGTLAQAPTLGGMQDGIDSATPSLSGGAQPQQPWRPTPEHLLEAAKARTDKLFELGRTNEAVKLWAQDEAMRGSLRKQAAERGLLSYKASGDPTELLTGIYKTIDDGWDIESVKPSAGLDGKTGFAIERVNQRTGKRQSSVIGAEQIEGLIGFALNPQEAATYSLKQKLEAFKGEVKKGEQDHKGAVDRETDAAKSRLTLGEIRARGAEERRTKATPTASDNTFTLGPGQERYRIGADGKPQKIASGPPKERSEGKIDWTGLAAKHYGQPSQGLLGGSRTAGPDTMALSISAQEIYEANKDRPGMTPEKAVELAARAHGADKAD